MLLCCVVCCSLFVDFGCVVIVTDFIQAFYSHKCTPRRCMYVSSSQLNNNKLQQQLATRAHNHNNPSNNAQCNALLGGILDNASKIGITVENPAYSLCYLFSAFPTYFMTNAYMLSVYNWYACHHNSTLYFSCWLRCNKIMAFQIFIQFGENTGISAK